MSGCRWRTHLAIGGLVFLLASPLFAQEPQERPAEVPPPVEERQRVTPDSPDPEPVDQLSTTEEQLTTPGTDQSIAPVPAQENLGDTQVAEEGGESENRRKADLRAQRRMADAAEQQARWTVRQFWITVIEIVALVATAGAAAWAAFAASSAARITRESNEIARETARQELRAYITADDTGLSLISVPGPTPGLAAHVNFTYRNNGKTPAYNVRGRMDVMVAERPLIGPLPTREFRDSGSITTAGPGREGFYVISNHVMTEDQINQIRRGTHALYIWGRIEYQDIFYESTHRTNYTNFRHWSKATNIGGPYPVTQANEGNDAT